MKTMDAEKEEETIIIDLRNKGLAEVLEEASSRHVLADYDCEDLRDITQLYRDDGMPIGDDSSYVKVIRVYLARTWEEVGGKIRDKLGPKIEFILWNSRQVPQRADCDLHGFVRHDGGIDWGQRRTINMTR